MPVLHLAVLRDDSDQCQAAELWNPARHEFVWSHNFAAFRVVALRWWDDASYRAYQAGLNGWED